jgi:hypothetical protein
MGRRPLVPIRTGSMRLTCSGSLTRHGTRGGKVALISRAATGMGASHARLLVAEGDLR